VDHLKAEVATEDNMRTIFFALLLLTAAALTPAATAQVVPGQQTGNETSANDPTRAIDDRTKIVSAELEDGTATVVIESDGNQTVSILDAGQAAVGSARPSDQRLTDGRNKIELSVTEINGRAALSITAESGFVSFVEFRGGTPLISGPFTAQDAQMTALTAALVVGALTLARVFRKLRGQSTEAEQLA
jgi:hypothetical protein